MNRYPSRDQINNWFTTVGTAALRLLPPEVAHDVGMKILESGLFDSLPAPGAKLNVSGLKVNIPGLGSLSHPIGLAAGFDKDCRAPAGFARMGFSFIEIGTVTPRPQRGNPKPRLFRYPEQGAIINRMGFNSVGIDVVGERLKRLNWSTDRIPLGLNAGKNKETPANKAANDFCQVIEGARGIVGYYVVNLSSPNTPGLRELANPEFIEELRISLDGDCAKTWVKFDPDLSKKEFQRVVEATISAGFQGLILTNTQRVTSPEAGGRSGHPLAIVSTRSLEWAWQVHQGRFPMIGNGGILSGSDIFQKIIRGASAVQIYSALVYQGPYVVARMLNELVEELKLKGFSTVQEAFGTYYT